MQGPLQPRKRDPVTAVARKTTAVPCSQPIEQTPGHAIPGRSLATEPWPLPAKRDRRASLAVRRHGTATASPGRRTTSRSGRSSRRGRSRGRASRSVARRELHLHVPVPVADRVLEAEVRCTLGNGAEVVRQLVGRVAGRAAAGAKVVRAARCLEVDERERARVRRDPRLAAVKRDVDLAVVVGDVLLRRMRERTRDPPAACPTGRRSAGSRPCRAAGGRWRGRVRPARGRNRGTRTGRSAAPASGPRGATTRRAPRGRRRPAARPARSGRPRLTRSRRSRESAGRRPRRADDRSATLPRSAPRPRPRARAAREHDRRHGREPQDCDGADHGSSSA